MTDIAVGGDFRTPQGSDFPTALDWSGRDDLDNPRNFPLRTRIASTVAATLLASVSTLAGSIYSPSHDEISRTFKVSQEVAILPLSLYNAGLAFGPLIGAPLSETFGRKAVFLTTTPVFALFILGSGVFAAPAVSNASATITDYTAGKYRAVSLAFYYSIPFLGALLGPLIGGFLVEYKDWRWTQWTVLFFIVAFGLPIPFTNETYKKTILRRRAKKLGLADSPIPRERTFLQASRDFLATVLFRPLHMLVTEPIVTLICMYNGFMFGLMYTYVVASPWVYATYYGFSLTGQSLSFLGLICGALLAPLPLITFDLCVYQPRLKYFRHLQEVDETMREQSFAPENRLFSAMAGSLVLPVSLFGFAWTARPSVPYLIPMIFQAISILSSLLIYVSISVYMLDVYGPLYGASAAGAAMFTRYSLSAAFPMFALQMYQGLGVHWATTILAFCTIPMAMIPWLFFKYGEILRSKMKYARSD